jgi:hypothetical protein
MHFYCFLGFLNPMTQKRIPKQVTIKNRIISPFGQKYAKVLYRPRPFQRAQICEDWSLGTGDMWRQLNFHKVKNIHI